MADKGTCDASVVDLTESPKPSDTQDCPICGLSVPTAELAAHCDAHFVAEESPSTAAVTAGRGAECPLCGLFIPATDADSHALAHSLDLEDHQGGGGPGDDIYLEQLRQQYGFEPRARPGRCHTCGGEGHWSSDCPRNPDNLAAAARVIAEPSAAAVIAAQRPDPQWRGPPFEPGALLRSLAEALVAQKLPADISSATALLAGPVAHFGGQRSDAGWGCGYRNIQMQASHLLTVRPEAQDALFGGAGYVPDIPALQAWVEVAWGAGFDAQGAEQLGGSLQGGKKWIGTSEAAVLLRFFGVPAKIVDFDVKAGSSDSESGGGGGGGRGRSAGGAAGGSRKAKRSAEEPHGIQRKMASGAAEARHISDGGGGSGPAAAHVGVQCDGCGALPIIGTRYRSQVLPDYDLCGRCYVRQGNSGAGPFAAIPPPPAAPSGKRPRTAGPEPATNGNGGGGNGGGEGPSRAGRALLEWVWEYFSEHQGPGKSENHKKKHESAAEDGAPSPSAAAGAAAAAGQEPKLFPIFNPRSPRSAAPHNGHQQPRDPPAVLSRAAPGYRLEARLTGRPPLYLQHEGHSRTIAGIERRQRRVGGPPEYSLLLLDPGVPPPALAAALSSGGKWARLVRRGAHTLRQSQFQVLYCPTDEPLVAAGTPRYEQLKTLVASARM